MAKSINGLYSSDDLADLKVRLEEAVKQEHITQNTRLILQAINIGLDNILCQIERGEYEWRNAFDAIKDPVFFHDGDYRIIRANKAYARQANMAIQDVIGKPYWQVFPKIDAPLPHCHQRLEDSGEVLLDEVTTGDGRIYLSRGFSVHDAQGNYHYSVHILEDISVQRRLQQEADENMQRYRRLFESAPDAVLLADAETGQLLDANPAAERLTGRSRAELMTLHQSELHPPDSIARNDFLEHVDAGKCGYLHKPTEVPLLNAKRGIIPVEITSCVFQLGHRKVIQGIFRDISGRKIVEQALHDSEETFRAISNAAQDAVLLLDEDGKIAYWNPTAEQIFGYASEEVIGQDAHLLLAPARYLEAWKRAWPRFKKSGDGSMVGKVLELFAKRKEGTEFPIELSVSAVQIRERWHAVGVLRDVTERKRAEDNLSETNNKLSQSLHLLEGIVESVPIRVFWKDQNLQYLGCNTLFAKDAGLTRPDELDGKTDFDMGWREQAHLYRDDDRRVMESGVSKLGYEEQQTAPDGKTIWLRTSKVPLRNGAGEVTGVLGIYDDITRQKQAELDLMLSETRLKEAQAVAHLGSWELDLVKNDLWWSDENYRIFGVDPGSRNTYETFLARVHPDDREFVNKTYTDSVQGKTVYDIEHRLLMPDGRVKWVNERCKTLYDDDGRPIRSAGTTLDITERKRSEAKVERLGHILDNSINEIYVFDAETLKFILVNEGAQHNLGYSMAELSELTPLALKPEFSAETFKALVVPLREDEDKLQVFETLHRRKDGSQYPVEVHLQFSAKEIPPVFVATILDISERRKADERLRCSESGLAEAQRIAHLGNWEFDIVHQRASWSDEMYRIFELESEKADASYETFLSIVHPEDREEVERTYRDSIESKAPYSITHRLLMPDGRIKYVHEMCVTHYGVDGRPLRSLGTVQDITSQCLTEQALGRSNRALKAISSCNSVLVHADNETDLLNNMCNVIIEAGGYRFAWIGYVEDGEAKQVRPVAHAGYEKGYLDQIKVTYTDTEHGQGPAGCAVRHGEVQVVHDTLTDAHFRPWREAAIERGYHSVVALPLLNTSGGVFAVLAIYAGEPNAFDADALMLLREMANDLAFGILALRTRYERDHYLQAHQKSDERFKQVLVDTIHAISLTVEKRDPYTAGHQYKVAQLSVAIGRELGMNADRLEGLRLGAMIHDIGKIYVPAEILNRPGRLTSAEFEIIKSHSEVGYDIIKDVQFPWPVSEMVLQHHERINGSGYPKGLHGDEIILEAKILAVADVVEAITAHRPYRPAVGLDKALNEIEAKRGTLYDPKVADACLHLIRDKGFSFEENNKA